MSWALRFLQRHRGEFVIGAVLVIVLFWQWWERDPFGVRAALTATPACPSNGSLPWPILQPGAPQVGKGYLQVQDQDGLHLGIDIVTPATSKVLAVEDGTVAYVGEETLQSHFEFLVDNGLGRGFLYVHVDPESFDLELGNTVVQGQLLAEVATFVSPDCPDGDPGCYEHLHLQACVPGDTGIVNGKWEDYLASDNPLRLLQPRDDQPPELVLLAPVASCSRPASEIALCANGFFEPLCPDGIEDEQVLDVIVCARDAPGVGSSWNNAPFCTVLEVRSGTSDTGPIQASFRQEYDGPESDTGSMLSYGGTMPFESQAPTIGAREFYLVLTNDMFADGAWTAKAPKDKPATYRLDAWIRDAAGNLDHATTTVIVKPKPQTP